MIGHTVQVIISTLVYRTVSRTMVDAHTMRRQQRVKELLKNVYNDELETTCLQ